MMSLNKYSQKIWGSISLLMLVFCIGCATTIKYHPTYLERKGVIKKIAVMPPEIKIFLITATEGNKLIHDLTVKIEKDVLSEMENLIKEKGFTFQDIKLAEEDLDKEPDLKFEINKVQKKFNQVNEKIMKDIYKKELNYSIGSEVNQFADRADADGLIFIRGIGFKKSAGQVTKDFLKSLAIGIATAGAVTPAGYTYSTVSLQVALVDSDTGEILWYNKKDLEIDPANEQQIKNLLKGVFDKFPGVK